MCTREGHNCIGGSPAVQEQGRQARSRRNLALAEAGKSLRNLQASQKVMASHKAPQSSRKALEAHATPAEVRTIAGLGFAVHTCMTMPHWVAQHCVT